MTHLESRYQTRTEELTLLRHFSYNFVSSQKSFKRVAVSFYKDLLKEFSPLMSRLTRHLIFACLILTLVLPVPFAAQQDRNQNNNSNNRNTNSQQTQDPTERTPRNRRPELNEAYRRWLDRDVAYIITEAERRAFRRLQTDEEREQFIEMFWRRRDPDPDTDVNEYREEYLERIAYANQHFASGVPGWRTDRGRIYIMFGPPDGRESNPTGGQYQRPSYHGGGSTTTYPFEVWFYRHIPGVGSGIEIEFVDPTGSGEYRIARSPDEKDAMLYVPGAGMTMAEQLGLQSRADRIAGMYGGLGNANYSREADNPFTRLQLYADLQRPPQVRFNDLESALTSSPTVDDNPLDFDVRVDFFRQSDDRVITAFTIQTENRNLTFTDVGGVQTATANIHGRITSVSGRRVTVFEDPIRATATPQELAEQRELKSAYQRAVPLPPGTYRVDVIMRDVNSGATGIRNIGFTVPQYDPTRLSTSTLVLAARLNAANAPGMFTIGQHKVIPNVSGTYRRGQEVGIYMQVYNAEIDQTTLRPAVDVEYVVMRGGQEIARVAEDWRGMSAELGQRLTLARLLPTTGLAAGEYEITIRIRDRVSGQSLAPSARFTLTD
jgi:GWxTD domain-containing protein